MFRERNRSRNSVSCVTCWKLILYKNNSLFDLFSTQTFFFAFWFSFIETACYEKIWIRTRRINEYIEKRSPGPVLCRRWSHVVAHFIHVRHTPEATDTEGLVRQDYLTASCPRARRRKDSGKRDSSKKSLFAKILFAPAVCLYMSVCVCVCEHFKDSISILKNWNTD